MVYTYILPVQIRCYDYLHGFKPLCVRVCVADLSRGLNAPEETEEDDNPGHGQAAQDRETHLSKVPNIIRDVQHIVPEIDRENI